jgi:L-alanine-DL-glutamate epimerase-like enolase superfamily enzyme
MLLEMGCCDIIQPDVNWCGGITELIKISALADAHGALMVPHGSGPYSYHFCCTRHNSPFNEIIMSAPKADKVLPAFHPLLLDEPAADRAPEDDGARQARLRGRTEPRVQAPPALPALKKAVRRTIGRTADRSAEHPGPPEGRNET